MSQESQVRPPPVIWAQRTNLLYVTICLEDCKNPTIDVQSDKIHFKGIGGTDAKEHEVTINLYKEIDSDKTVKNEKGRMFELVLIKKEEGPYWPRLTKENQKYHWLKIDFSKWKDEDDSEDEDGNAGEGPGDMNQMMQSMLGGMGGMGGMQPKDDFADLDEADSDDEDIPPLE